MLDVVRLRSTRAPAALACLAAMAIARDAVGAPTSKLTYVRGPGSEACPSESELRSAVAKRVGYDPFFPFAPRTVVAQIERVGRGFRAQIRIVEESGSLVGDRVVGPMSDCG